MDSKTHRCYIGSMVMLIVWCLVTTLASMKHHSSFLGYSSITDAPQGIRSSIAPTTAWSYMVVDHGLILPLCFQLWHSWTLNCLSSQGIKSKRKGRRNLRMSSVVFVLDSSALLPCRPSALHRYGLTSSEQFACQPGGKQTLSHYLALGSSSGLSRSSPRCQSVVHNGSKKPNSILTFLSPQFGHSFTCQGKAQLEPVKLRMSFLLSEQ